MNMKMFLQLLLLAVIVVISAYLLFYFFKVYPPVIQKQEALSSVCIGKNCFQVELEKTEAQREQGLMFRKELDKDKGMLFIFDKEGFYPFWMKNTLIPLDMVWIDANNNVIFFAQDVQPCKSFICPSVIPTGKAKYVLELNAGTCKDIGLKLGDTVDINIK